MSSVRKTLSGAVVALLGISALTALMVGERTHLSLATPGMVLVVPVVAGVAVGGFGAGIFAVVIGFLSYDLFFIPPYSTLAVGSPQNWVALFVYAVVMLVVSKVVSDEQRARAKARRHEENTRRLYVLSDLLIADKSLSELLALVVTTIHDAFGPRWVAALLPDGTSLVIAANAGEQMTDDERLQASSAGGQIQSVIAADEHDVTRIVLTAMDRPIGLLAFTGVKLDTYDRELLATYANQAALAVERIQLQEKALRSELLEEVDRWRDALMGAVSHDLRTPLASVKTAVSTLRHSGDALSTQDQTELLELIESQSDNLARLVTNLLDMTRIQAGALELRRDIVPINDVIDEALRALGLSDADCRIELALPDDLPLVDIDQQLMTQVLANLIDNALRHSPETRRIEIAAETGPSVVELSVRDHGPGVAPEQREQIFQMFNRVSGAGRAGLGLTIVKAFVEAHGQSVRVEQPPGGGARFVFTLPQAEVPVEAN